MIDIKGLDKADVLRALHAAARPLGMGLLHAREPMTREEAIEMIEMVKASRPRFEVKNGAIHFDYVHGCPLKVNIGGDELDPCLYDRDQGQGAAALAIAGLRERLAKETP